MRGLFVSQDEECGPEMGQIGEYRDDDDVIAKHLSAGDAVVRDLPEGRQVVDAA